MPEKYTHAHTATLILYDTRKRKIHAKRKKKEGDFFLKMDSGMADGQCILSDY